MVSLEFGNILKKRESNLKGKVKLFWLKFIDRYFIKWNLKFNSFKRKLKSFKS